MRWLTFPVAQFLATGFVTLVVVVLVTEARPPLRRHPSPAMRKLSPSLFSCRRTCDVLVRPVFIV